MKTSIKYFFNLVSGYMPILSGKSIFTLMLVALIPLFSCKKEKPMVSDKKEIVPNEVSLVILGTIQDAGSPQIGCKKECCKDLFSTPDPRRKVVSLGVIDKQNQNTYLFEATPDIGHQIKVLSEMSGIDNKEFPDGVFLTHAHIGHYSGLMYFGIEAANTRNMDVYAMPRMRQYLGSNGPWSQLLTKENIRLQAIDSLQTVQLNQNLQVLPLSVPHRDEYSETVGFIIKGPNKQALFIPDIDKWTHWDTSITDLIKQVDYAFLDATFYYPEEIKTRDLTKVLHPFVVDSMDRFEDLSGEDRKKVHFIHFNHTNPLLNPGSNPYKTVLDRGFRVAEYQQSFEL